MSSTAAVGWWVGGVAGARRYGTGSWSMLQMRNQCELDDLSSLASRLRPFGSSDHTAHAAARLRAPLSEILMTSGPGSMVVRGILTVALRYDSFFSRTGEAVM